MNWENVKIFLALVREGSVRAAGAKLEISHATVARRIGAFETKLGVKLFDRLPNGLAMTVSGEELLQSALKIEEEMVAIERRISGQDTRLQGMVRVTMPDVMATHLIMPDLVEFVRQYPDIDLQIMPSYEFFDLSQRQADVAIRVVHHDRLPPEYLVGHRLVTYAKAVYASNEYLREHDLTSNSSNARWIGWGDLDLRGTNPKILRFPDWVKQSDYAHIPVYNSLNSVLLQTEAAKQGMGLAMLPCFLGDKETSLVRIPPGTAEPAYDVWLLTHPDLKDTARLRTFRHFISKAVEKYRDLLEGNCLI